MKQAERDELLYRMDETVKNIWRVTEQQERHLERINGHLEDHSKRITIVETLQKERNRPSKKTLGGWGAVIVAAGVAVWKAFYGD